jgi:trimeric autotransporter adhesin
MNSRRFTMKKLILSAFCALFLTSVAKAMTPTYTQSLVDDPALAVDTNYSLDLNAQQVDYLSFQAVYSSAQVAGQTFTDGRVSTGSIRVASITGLSPAAASNTVTIAATSALAPAKATNHVTVVSTQGLSGAILTVNGIRLIAGRDWFVTTATGTAESIKSLLTEVTGLNASRASTVVYATATTFGLIGNSYTMNSSTPTALTVASANFTGGKENGLTNAVLTINGNAYVNGYLWKSLDPAGVDNSTIAATSIAALINTISGLKASAASSVVFATATVAGSAGNSFTMASSTPSAMTVGNATFTGGLSSATIRINGVTLTAGVNWTVGASTQLTASSIATAINANSSLNSVIVSTFASNIVYATSTLPGSAYNYSIVTNPSDKLVAGSAFTGGSEPSYSSGTAIITIPNHGFTLGLPVLYTSSTISITNLTNQTTYYAVPRSVNTISLATSKANAQNGTYITLGSIATNASHTFTLTPLAITGSPSFKWQISNDGSNWTDSTVSSVTFGSPYTATTTFWDFGLVTMHYIRLKVTAPTTGGLDINVIGNGKSSNP